MGPILRMDAKERQTLDITKAVADSVCQAILEDFVIFDLSPKVMKYGAEIAIAFVESKPIAQVGQMAEGVGKGIGAGFEGFGKSIKYEGEGVQAAAKGLYPWKDLF